MQLKTLYGCASSALAIALIPALSVLANDVGSSRIRVFGQNGAFADLHPGSACLKREGRERVSGSMGSAFGSLVGKVSNVSLGIPQTATTRNLAQMDGIASKAYFREYAIPAGIPTSLRLGFRDVSSFYTVGNINYSNVSPSCSGAISFTPEAGQDYEVGFSWKGRTCQLSVNQVVVDGAEVHLVPMPVANAPKC